MPDYNEVSRPYELLFRFNTGPEGGLQGAHIGFLDVMYKDGVIITQNPRPVECVAVAEEEGFPLSQALQLLHVELLKERDNLSAQVAQLTASLNEIEEYKNGLIIENTALINENTDLKAKMVALTPPVVVVPDVEDPLFEEPVPVDEPELDNID